MNRYENIKTFILSKLKTELSQNLHYHGLHHTLDVLNVAGQLAKLEAITELESEWLNVAVLFHDSGFIVDSKNHEQIGCDFAKQFLPEFGYSDAEIETICGMIMATKFPHNPKNHLEEIICDADLDYLGRDDYFKISNHLYDELKMKGALKNEKEWYQLQENFLNAHTYFTKSAERLRKAKKQEHLDQIRETLKSKSA